MNEWISIPHGNQKTFVMILGGIEVTKFAQYLAKFGDDPLVPGSVVF